MRSRSTSSSQTSTVAASTDAAINRPSGDIAGSRCVGTSGVANIRQLFLDAHPAYDIAEAATLLGIAWRDLRGWIESGEIEGIETDDGLGVPWAELVSFGMEMWSQEVVEEALGAEVIVAIPELLRLTELAVRIPRMEVVALERLAAVDGESVSAVLARELRDLVSVHAPWLSVEVPGFAEAFAWPARCS